MADISKLTVGSNTYDIKDATARSAISSLEGGMKYLGVTTTALTNGSTTNPISINGNNVTATTGNVAIYGNAEFVFDGTKWDEFGDLSTLGSLAYQNTATGTFTPAGSVSMTETIASISTLATTGTLPSVNPTVESITPIATVGTLPSSTYDSATETLTIDWGTLPTAGTAVSAVTNIGFSAGSLPTSGSATVVTGTSASFTGTEGTINVS
ncbi:MAG: hypothetical protein IKY26_04090 [Erysipelotrichaceae bacterium]|nr:hypothetical protein [Erysipelotrichaceae bacterium]